MPLVEAMRHDSGLRGSEYGWIVEPKWGSRPLQYAVLDDGRISDRVIGQLKRAPSGLTGAAQQVLGVILGVAFVIFGIPLMIVGLFKLASANVLWLPVLLIIWLLGVTLLVGRALRPQEAPNPYRQAMVRLDDLSYCTRCGVIFERESGNVIPLEQLHDRLYAAAH
jgi:hypothetical protein